MQLVKHIFLIGRSSLQSYDNFSVVVNKSSSIWGKVGGFLILVFEKYKHNSCCNGFLSGKWISKSQGLCLMDRISKIAINDSADLHMQRFVHVIAYCAWFDVQVEELRFFEVRISTSFTTHPKTTGIDLIKLKNLFVIFLLTAQQIISLRHKTSAFLSHADLGLCIKLTEWIFDRLYI